MDSPIPRPSPPSHASFEERLRPLEWSKRRKIARFRPESRMKALVLDTRVPTETTKHKTKIFQYATAAYMPGPFSSSPDVYSGWVHYWPCARQCVMLRCDGGEWKLATGPLESIPSPLKGDVPLKRAPEYLKSLYRCFDAGTMPRPWVFFFFIDTRSMHARSRIYRRRNSFDEIDLRNDGGKRMGTVSGNRNCLFIYGKLFDIIRG